MHEGETSGGKYDEDATELRKKLGAQGVCLIVKGGNKGHGFTVQGDLQFIVLLPEVLEEAAASMRQQMQSGEFNG